MKQPTKEEISDFKLAVLKYTSEVYLQHKHGVSPTLFLLSNDGFRKRFDLPEEAFNTQNNKDGVTDLMLDIIRASNSGLICFVTEGYMLPESVINKIGKEEAMKIRPSEHPERDEVLQLYFEADGDKTTLMTFIIEEEDGEYNLTPQHNVNYGEDDENFASMGRFNNLLEKAKDKNYKEVEYND